MLVKLRENMKKIRRDLQQQQEGIENAGVDDMSNQARLDIGEYTTEGTPERGEGYGAAEHRREEAFLMSKTATFVDGYEIAQDILQDLAKEIDARLARGKRAPNLVIVNVGASAENLSYIKQLKEAAAPLKMLCTVTNLLSSVDQDKVLEIIRNLNNDDHVDGIVVTCQDLKHIKSSRLNSTIIERKDITGKTLQERNHFDVSRKPCLHMHSSPMGIFEILKRFNIKLPGQKMLIAETSCTVTTQLLDALKPELSQRRVHPRQTSIFSSETVKRQSIPHRPTTKIYIYNNSHKKETMEKYFPIMDIITTNFDRPWVINTSKLKQGVTIIDTGIFKMSDPETTEIKKVGNVNFEVCKNIVGQFLPTPGTFGPIFIAVMMKKCFNAAEMNDNALELKDPHAWLEEGAYVPKLHILPKKCTPKLTTENRQQNLIGVNWGKSLFND